jgi:hypothetical protein
MFRMTARDRRRAVHQPLQVALEQGDARAFDRNVGPGSHRHADVRRRQRRGVIHAVARHRDLAPLGAKPLHDTGLVLRQHIGCDLIDTKRVGDGFGGGLIVARHDHHPHTLRLEGGNRCRCRGLDRVGNGENRRDLAVHAHENGRRAVAAALLCLDVETLSARMRKEPVLLRAPPITLSPATLVTGIDSPVTIDSSMDTRPSSISPSTGTFSPGRTRRRSPT